MKSVRVFILTTEGPVEVQRITEEDPGVQSVICLDGKAVSLPVSPAYEAFVRSPTGVIEACFGHPAYRLDVSGRITEGLSWQLGVFLAHALYAGNLLTHGDGDVAIFTTGEVDRDLNVLSVDNVPEKLRRADPYIDELHRNGTAVTIFLPKENAPPRQAAVPVIPVATIADVFNTLKLKAPPTALPPDVAATQRRSRLMRPALLVALVVVFALGVVAYRYLPRDAPPTSPSPIAAATPEIKPEPAPVVRPVADLITTVVETRPPVGETCAAVHFNKATPTTVELAIANSGRFAESKLQALCGLAYRITNRGPPVKLTVLGIRNAQEDNGLQAKLFFRGQLLDQGAHVSLPVKSVRSAIPVHLRFLLFVETIPDGVSRLPKEIGAIPEPVTDAFIQALASKSPKEGLEILKISHVLVP